jgi:hypothetical protein
LKIRPKFLPKLLHKFNRGKNCPKIWATSVIFKKTTKANNDPIGEKSSYLATLAVLDMLKKDQGDLMSLFKNRQNAARPFFVKFNA